MCETFTIVSFAEGQMHAALSHVKGGCFHVLNM